MTKKQWTIADLRPRRVHVGGLGEVQLTGSDNAWWFETPDLPGLLSDTMSAEDMVDTLNRSATEGPGE